MPIKFNIIKDNDAASSKHLRKLYIFGIVIFGILTIVASGDSYYSLPHGPDILAPVQVSGSHTFTNIGTGYNHSCAAAVDGTTYCWGKNEYGELGSTTDMDVCTAPLPEGFPCTGNPVPVENSPAFSSLGGSVRHTCGLTTDGLAYCWGFGIGGQLGDGNSTSSINPVLVAGGHTFIQLSVGISGPTCGIVSTGQIYCWGINSRGQLGTGDTEYSPIPIPVASSQLFKAVSVGDNHTCAVSLAGNAYCWGSNWYGQLGVGSAGGSGGLPESLLPIAVDSELIFETIAAGSSHTCALTEDGSAFCWGLTRLIGSDTTDTGGYSDSPTAVEGGHTFELLDAGALHTCGLTSDGTAYCWGENAMGTLGDGTLVSRTTPIPVMQGDLRFKAVSAGGTHTCVLTMDNSAYCWGGNPWGQCGTPGYDVVE